VTPGEHRLLPHTADAGLEASGPDLETVFEEAAFALAGMTADIAPEALIELDGDALPTLRRVRLAGRDLAALAYAWLNELVGRVDVAGALAAIEVESVFAVADQDGWSLAARVATVPFDGRLVRRRTDVKSATFHRLAVDRDPDGGWRLTAYLDI
jgi:SHS2 domain-containing protein